MTKTSFPWIRKIAAELGDLNTIPLFGNAPPIDLDRLSSLLSASLQAKISLRLSGYEWRSKAEVKKGLGTNPLTIAFSASPLASSIFWTMPRADVDKLVSKMLYEKGKGKPSEIIREGFYHYLLLETLDALQEIEPLKKLTFELQEDEEITHESNFCIDIEIQIDDKTCWGTLSIPASFRKKWISHFSQIQSNSAYTPTETFRQTELILGIKIAESTLNQEEWEEMEPGDFLLLDHGSYNLHETGMATLQFKSTPLFHIKIEQNKLELLNYASTHEEPMEKSKKNYSEILEEAKEEAGSIKHVPLTITVELARVRMTLDRLMHLSPGNLLEMPLNADQQVSLSINGAKVGKGELVHLGEMLGVRILEIGS